MIESVERLKKFVDEYRGSSNIYAMLSGTKLTLSDLKEALSLIPPYAPGEEIEVSNNKEFDPKCVGRFIGFRSNGCVVIEELNTEKAYRYHRLANKTVDLKGFPVELVELAEQNIKRDRYCEGTFSKRLCQAIVTSARKE